MDHGVPELPGAVEFAPILEIGRTARGVRFNKVYWSGGAIGEVPFHEEALAPEPEKLR
jgi:hypothetical protein